MPPSPSAICTVNGNSISTSGTSGINVSPGSTITVALASISGVASWSISATNADDITWSNGNLISVNNSKIVSGYSATFIVPDLSVDGYRGAGLQFTSIVNSGLYNEDITTFGVWVLNSNGSRLFFGSESFEGNATVGNAEQLNDIMVSTSGGGGGGGGFTAGGDLSGTSTSQKVIGLQGHPLASTAPVNSAVAVWDSSIFDIRQLTADDIAPGFTINSFTGGSTVEIGATVTNPTFTISYSSTPSAASITNTDSIDSPLTLTFPYTSGTVVGSFHHTAAATVTFTLSATGTATKTSTSSIVYLPRSFSGVGSAGASSATASGTSAVLNSSLGTLSNSGLFTNVIGQAFIASPSTQKIYLLLPHTATVHTFSSGGFSFPMNSPTNFTFTNQNSATVSMDLYESTNTLSATFNILVAS